MDLTKSHIEGSCSQSVVSQTTVTKTNNIYPDHDYRDLPGYSDRYEGQTDDENYDSDDENYDSADEVEVIKIRRKKYLPGDRGPPRGFPFKYPSSLSPDHRYSDDSSDPSDSEAAVVREIRELDMLPTAGKHEKSQIRFLSSPRIDPDYLYWIQTDGYFRENGKIAGYGVVVKDHLGNPIIARSISTTKPISPLYHHLQGVLEGYRIAKELGIKILQVVCNHCWTHDVLNTFEYEGAAKCFVHPNNQDYDHDLICKICVSQFFGKSDSLFLPILQEIVELAAHNFTGFMCLADWIPRYGNKVADCMAKYGKKCGREGTFTFKPSEFPKELKKLLLVESMNALNGVPFDAPPKGFLHH